MVLLAVLTLFLAAGGLGWLVETGAPAPFIILFLFFLAGPIYALFPEAEDGS